MTKLVQGVRSYGTQPYSSLQLDVLPHPLMFYLDILREEEDDRVPGRSSNTGVY